MRIDIKEILSENNKATASPEAKHWLRDAIKETSVETEETIEYEVEEPERELPIGDAQKVEEPGTEEEVIEEPEPEEEVIEESKEVEEPEPEIETERELPIGDAEEVEETEHDSEPEEEVVQTPPKQVKESKGKYSGVVAILIAMIAMVAATVYLTTMIPRTIYATIDGEAVQIDTKKYTLQKALEEAGISYCDEDYISMSADGYVVDGMTLTLTHAKDFTITADGQTLEYKSLENTVGDALEEEGIKLGKLDIVKPAIDQELNNGMSIVVQRVEKKKETRTEVIKFKTEVVYVDTLKEGKKEVVSEGKNGEAEVTYEITYTDGKETKKKEIDRQVTKKAVNEVINEGTAVAFEGKMYRKKLTVKAYSYTGGGRTAMGTRARVGEIAVDPRVIPLGTTVYIPGVGERRAEDTGGNIKGNTIDIYMNSVSACRKWGRRTITIYIK